MWDAAASDTEEQPIIERGCRSGRFHAAQPRLAAFAVLEMGNGAKSWFKPGGPYSDLKVAQEYGEFALRIVGCTDRVAGQQPSSASRRHG